MFRRIGVWMILLFALMLPICALAEGETSPLIDSAVTIDNGVRRTILDRSEANVYTWSSSDKAVAVVDSRGRVTGRKAGVCVISAKGKDGSVYECVVTVVQPATRVYIKASEAKVERGESYVLTPVISPANATDKTLSYTSSNEAVAVVSPDGVITAVKAGRATITAKAHNGLKDSIKITVTQKVTSLSLTDGVVNVGGTLKLSALIGPEDATDKTLVWTSSDKSIASVSSKGVVSGRKLGTCVITATAKSGVTASCTITVVQPVKKVYIKASEAKVERGESYVLTPVISPANATDKTLSYTSSNEAVAVVSPDGVITAVKAGRATITAKAHNGLKDSIKITVTQKVTSLSLTDGVVNVDGTLKLSALIGPEDATDKTLVWTSSDKSIASVSSKGVVSGRKLGTCVITATAKSGATASCTITVVQPVKKVYIKASEVKIERGESYVLTPEISPDNATDKTVIYTSSNEAVASVSPDGVITAVKAGRATITAKALSGAKDTIKVTVTQKVTSLSLTDGVVNVDGTLKLSALIGPEDATDKTLVWTSSDKSIASVSSKGVVSGRKLGTCVITATAKSGVTASCTITVVQPVRKVYIKASEVKIEQGESYVLTPVISPDNATDKTVIYTSSNEAVASVSPDGVITAVKAGRATITATALSGAKDTIKVTVTQKVTSLSLTDGVVNVDGTLKLSALIGPEDATDKTLVWTSSDKSIAQVNYKGVVSGERVGTCVITATAKSGVTASCTITVVQPVKKVYIKASEVKIERGESYALTPVISPDNATDKTVIYTSSNEAVASVSPEGVITAVKAGRATITATALSGAKDTIKVTVTQKVTSLSLTDGVVNVDGTLKLSALIGPEDATDKTLVWTSSDKRIAQVNHKGVVSGERVGTCVITATAKSGVTASCTITVVQPVSAVVIGPSKKTIGVNSTYQLETSIRPSNATDKNLIYYSSNPAVAKVDEKGLITGMSEGRTVVTAASANGKKDTITITVEFIEMESIMLSPGYLHLNPGSSAQLQTKIVPEESSQRTLRFVSDNPGVASVDSEGVVTAHSVGAATVSAVCADNSQVFETCRVFVRDPNSAGRLAGIVVGINAGHQIKGNRDLAPIAPGSSVKKSKVGVGCAGIRTRRNEYEINLEVSLMLRDMLEAEGATVVMVRTRNDVNLTNIQRATMLNEAGVDVALQIHCNSSAVDDPRVKGIELYVKPTDQTAFEMSCLMLDEMVAHTGAVKRGVKKSTGYMSLNWSETPSILVELGYMSNPTEDVLLCTPSYQMKLVEGMYEGIARYFGR